MTLNIQLKCWAGLYLCSYGNNIILGISTSRSKVDCFDNVVGTSSHFWLIFGIIFGSFWLFGRRMIRMDQRMKSKMMWKMATVNALKHKHPENEVKMHFTYLRQCSADSNSPSKDWYTKLLAWVTTHWHTFKSFIWKLGLHRYSFCTTYNNTTKVK